MSYGYRYGVRMEAGLTNAIRSSLWTPASLPDVRGFYTTTRADLITLDQGAVAAIACAAGVGAALTQGAGASQPIFDPIGRTVTFDGADDILRGTQAAFLSENDQVTLVHMGRKIARAAGEHLGGVVTGGGVAGAVFAVSASNVANADDVLNLRFFNGRGDTATEAAAGAEVCIVARYDGTTHAGATARVNGAARTVTASAPSNVMAFASEHEFTWGASLVESVPGNFSNYAGRAMVIVDGVISDADAQRVEGWWAHQFGQAALLPSDHPFKASAPRL